MFGLINAMLSFYYIIIQLKEANYLIFLSVLNVVLLSDNDDVYLVTPFTSRRTTCRGGTIFWLSEGTRARPYRCSRRRRFCRCI